MDSIVKHITMNIQEIKKGSSGKCKRALVTGCNGQDGSYLCELLLNTGYEVYGMERRSSSQHRENVKHIEKDIHFVTRCNGQDGSYLCELLLNTRYEVYGMERRSSSQHRENVKHIEKDIHFVT